MGASHNHADVRNAPISLLLEGVPAGLDLGKLEAVILSVPGVAGGNGPLRYRRICMSFRSGPLSNPATNRRD